MPASTAQTHRIRYSPHRWQRHFHESTTRDRAVIAGIRGGKTVGGSMEGLRLAIGEPIGVGLISGPDLPTLKQTVLRTIMDGMGPGRFGQWPRELIKSYNRTEQLITLVDGNQVLIRGADNPDSLRGPAAKWWWLDEASLCKREVLPILQGRTLDAAPGTGRGIVTCTPKGKNNWIATDIIAKCQEVTPGRVWRSDRWEVVRYPSRENPGLRLEEVEALGDNYSQHMRAQELEAELVDWGGALFLNDALTRCAEMTIPHWQDPRAGHVTLVGFDPAGKGKDCSVLVAICRTCRAVVDVWRCQRLPFAALYQEVEDFCRRWQPLVFRADTTAMGGQAVWEEIEPRILKVSRRTDCQQFDFTAKSKAEMLNVAASRIEDGVALPMTADAAFLLAQLRAYEWDDKGLETDGVMAFGLAALDLPPMGERPAQLFPDAVGEREVGGGYRRVEFVDL